MRNLNAAGPNLLLKLAGSVFGALMIASPADARPGEYGRLRAEFRVLCELLKEDGRSDLVARLLEPRLAKDPACIDCRPLFMQLFNPCKPPPAPKAKNTPRVETGHETDDGKATGGEATGDHATDAEHLANDATPPETSEGEKIEKPARSGPQRMPQIAVLDLASELSRELAADERNPEQTRQAVEQLRKVLLPSDLTPGERDYMDTLTTFLLSGFESDIIPPASAIKKPSTKGLFGDDEEEEQPTEDHAADDGHGVGKHGTGKHGSGKKNAEKHGAAAHEDESDQELDTQSSGGFR